MLISVVQSVVLGRAAVSETASGGLNPKVETIATADTGRQLVTLMRRHVELLGIGLDYTNLNRRSSNLSGGES